MFGSESAIDGASTVERGARIALVDMDGSKRVDMIASDSNEKIDDLREVFNGRAPLKWCELNVRRTRCDVSRFRVMPVDLRESVGRATTLNRSNNL